MSAIKAKGFTLIELLVVIAILGVITGLSLSTFRGSQIKARDAKRKSDLEQVQRALEMYYNDKNFYPADLAWGEAFVDPDHSQTVYLKQLPRDPIASSQYCFVSDGVLYRLYARLENSQDPVVAGPYSCSGEATYNYQVTSSNAQL